jgi:hypothetical protein
MRKSGFSKPIPTIVVIEWLNPRKLVKSRSFLDMVKGIPFTIYILKDEALLPD